MDCACQGAVVGVDIAEPGLLNAAQSPAQHDTDLGIDLQQGCRGSRRSHKAGKGRDGIMHSYKQMFLLQHMP